MNNSNLNNLKICLLIFFRFWNHNRRIVLITKNHVLQFTLKVPTFYTTLHHWVGVGCLMAPKNSITLTWGDGCHLLQICRVFDEPPAPPQHVTLVRQTFSRRPGAQARLSSGCLPTHLISLADRHILWFLCTPPHSGRNKSFHLVR